MSFDITRNPFYQDAFIALQVWKWTTTHQETPIPPTLAERHFQRVSQKLAQSALETLEKTHHAMPWQSSAEAAYRLVTHTYRNETRPVFHALEHVEKAAVIEHALVRMREESKSAS